MVHFAVIRFDGASGACQSTLETVFHPFPRSNCLIGKELWVTVPGF